MNLQEMIDVIRISTDDIDKDRLSDNQLIALLNLSINKVFNLQMSLEYYPLILSATATFVANTQVTSIVADTQVASLTKIRKLLMAEDENGVEIDIKAEVFSRKNISKRSVFVRTSRTELGYHINPSAGFVVYLTYVPAPEKFILNSSPGTTVLASIEEQYHDCVTNWATVLALGSDEQNLTTWTSIYQASIQDMVESYTAKTETGQTVSDFYHGQNTDPRFSRLH